MPSNPNRALSLMGARPLPLVKRSAGPALAGGTRAYHAPGWYKKADHRKIAALRRFTKEHSLDPRLRWFVVNSIFKPAGIQQREYAKQGGAICRWVQKHVYYTNEDGEQLQSPWVTLQARTGDCDDMAILTAAMLQSVRLPWRFVLAGSYGHRIVMTPRGPQKVPNRARWVEPYREDRHNLPGYVQLAGGPPVKAQKVPRGFHPHHIYLQVGTPPFKPNEWHSFEPTVEGAPMGHDVVMHGIIKDTHLRGSGGGGLPEMGAWGDPTGLGMLGMPAYAFAQPYGAAMVPAEEPNATSSIFADWDWPDFFRSVMMSVATGVISAILLSRFRKRRAGRKRR